MVLLKDSGDDLRIITDQANANLLLSLISWKAITIKVVTSKLLPGVWICLGLRGFPGYGTFSAKTGTVLGKLGHSKTHH